MTCPRLFRFVVRPRSWLLLTVALSLGHRGPAAVGDPPVDAPQQHTDIAKPVAASPLSEDAGSREPIAPFRDLSDAPDADRSGSSAPVAPVDSRPEPERAQNLPDSDLAPPLASPPQFPELNAPQNTDERPEGIPPLRPGQDAVPAEGPGRTAAARTADIRVAKDTQTAVVQSLVRTLEELGVDQIRMVQTLGSANIVMVHVSHDATDDDLSQIRSALAAHDDFAAEIVRQPAATDARDMPAPGTRPGRTEPPDTAGSTVAGGPGNRRRLPSDVVVVPLLHNDAVAVCETAQTLFASDPVTISADSRTNQLLIRGDSEIVRSVEDLVRQLDASDPQTPGRIAEPRLDPGQPAAEQGGGQGVRTARSRRESDADPGSRDLRGEQELLPQPGPDFASTATRARCQELERQSRELATQLRASSAKGPERQSLERRLRQVVRQAFEAHQQRQREELNALTERLADLRQTLEDRDAAATDIVDRRVEELLDPTLLWNAGTHTTNVAPAAEPLRLPLGRTPERLQLPDPSATGDPGRRLPTPGVEGARSNRTATRRLRLPGHSGTIEWITAPRSVMGTGREMLLEATVGTTVRFRISDLPEDARVFVSIDLPEFDVSRHATVADILRNNPVPLDFPADDLRRVADGADLTRVTYVPDDLTQGAVSLMNVMTGFEPTGTAYLVDQAGRKGTVVCIVRMSRSDRALYPEDSGDRSAARAATPEAAIALMEEYGRTRDYAAFLGMLTDDEAQRLAGMLLQTTILASSLQELVGAEAAPSLQQLPDLLATHRRTDPPAAAVLAWSELTQRSMRQLTGLFSDSAPAPSLPDPDAFSSQLRQAAGILRDPRAFAADVMEVLQNDDPDDGEHPSVAADWKITRDGDTAIAVSSAASDSTHSALYRTSEIALRQIDSEWKISSLISDHDILKVAAGPTTTTPDENSSSRDSAQDGALVAPPQSQTSPDR